MTSSERTILVVEDEGGLRALIEEILRSEGYTVLLAQDGANAIRLSEACPSEIDLLLTDITLPGMGGQEIAARLSALRPGMRVLFMSGHAKGDIVGNRTMGVRTEFIQKPWTPQELCEKIQALLNTQTPIPRRQ